MKLFTFDDNLFFNYWSLWLLLSLFGVLVDLFRLIFEEPFDDFISKQHWTNYVFILCLLLPMLYLFMVVLFLLAQLVVLEPWQFCSVDDDIFDRVDLSLWCVVAIVSDLEGGLDVFDSTINRSHLINFYL